MEEQGLSAVPFNFNARGILRQNRLIIISSVIFILGLILGAFAVSLSVGGDVFGVLPLVKSSISSRQSSPFYVTFLLSAAVSLSFMLLMFLSSLSAFGWLFCPILLMFRGFCTGLISGCLYSQYALYGIGFFALILLLPYFIIAYTLIFACSDGMKISFKIFLSIFSNIPQQLRLTKYLAVRYALYAVFCLVSSFADAALSACFIKFFSF